MGRQSQTGSRTAVHHINPDAPRQPRVVGYALAMPARSKRDDEPDADPNKLKRETAGRYTTADGRFTVEQGSGGWMIVDGEQTNELGLPLVRGPFPTLDDARGGLDAARTGETPTSDLAGRIAELKDRGGEREREPRPGSKGRGRATGREQRARKTPEPEPIEIREFRPRDGDDLRRLLREDHATTRNDNASLKRLSDRNPGLLLVATQDKVLVGAAVGAWDGRLGWIYDIAVATDHRRGDLPKRLVRELEDRLRELGAQEVNAVVRDDDPGAALLWEAAGYARQPIRLYRRELDE
jgi:ribosomal protein S18 acetylase RimI-like enzyme